MDLFALAARLTLDVSGYEEGLAAAEAGFTGFAARLTEGLNTAERLNAATLDAAAACQGVGDAAGGAASALLSEFLAAAAAAVEGLNQYAPALSEAGASMLKGLGGGMAAAAEEAVAPARLAGDAIAEALTAPSGRAGGWGEDLMNSFIGGLNRQLPALRDAVEGIAETVHSYLHFSEPDVGPLSDFHTYAPDMMALFAQGIRDNAALVSDQINSAFDLAPGIVRAAEPAAAPRPEAAEAERPINIIFELEGAQQWIYRLNKAEEQRVGLRLSTGGAY